MGRYGSKECFNFISEIERQGKKRQSKGKAKAKEGKAFARIQEGGQAPLNFIRKIEWPLSKPLKPFETL